MTVVLPSGGSLLGRILLVLSNSSFWLGDVIITSPASLTDIVLTIASNRSGGSFNQTRRSKFHFLNGFS